MLKHFAPGDIYFGDDQMFYLSLQSPHGLPMRHSSSPKFAVKTRQAFYLQTTGLTRVARRLCQDIIRPRYLARHPYLPVNTAAIKAECKERISPFIKISLESMKLDSITYIFFADCSNS